MWILDAPEFTISAALNNTLRFLAQVEGWSNQSRVQPFATWRVLACRAPGAPTVFSTEMVPWSALSTRRVQALSRLGCPLRSQDLNVRRSTTPPELNSDVPGFRWVFRVEGTMFFSGQVSSYDLGFYGWFSGFSGQSTPIPVFFQCWPMVGCFPCQSQP